MKGILRRKPFLAAIVSLGCLFASSAEATTCWVVSIVNDTNHDFTMWVRDSMHEGIFFHKYGPYAGQEAGKNDGGRPFVIRRKFNYEAAWTGIPWFWQGKHRRTIMMGDFGDLPHPPGTYGLEIWQAGIEGHDYIVFNDLQGGNQEKIQIGGGNREYELRFFCKDRAKECNKEDVVMDLLLLSSGEDAESLLTRLANSERAQHLLDKITDALIDGTIETAKAAAKSGGIP
jgi:hypothetical protein